MRRVSLCLLFLAAMAGSAPADGPETGLVSGTSPTPAARAARCHRHDHGRSRREVRRHRGRRHLPLRAAGARQLRRQGCARGHGNGGEDRAGDRGPALRGRPRAQGSRPPRRSPSPPRRRWSTSSTPPQAQTMQGEVGVEVTGENRTFYGVINFMPGVTNEDENTDLASTRPNINGSTWADSTVYIDGVDTTFSRYGGTRVFLPSTATTEVSLESGGLGADYGRTVGSATNVIVKSGTNNYHGAVVYSRTEEKWNSEYDDQPAITRRQTQPAAGRLLRSAPRSRRRPTDDQYETSFGGPIKRDKAWFFVSVNEQNTNQTGKTINGDFVDESGNAEVADRQDQLPARRPSTRWRRAGSTPRSAQLRARAGLRPLHGDAARHLGRALHRELQRVGLLEVLPRGQARRPDLERGQAPRLRRLRCQRGDPHQAAGRRASRPTRPAAPTGPATASAPTSTTTAGTTAGCSTTGSGPTSSRARSSTSPRPTSQAASHELKYGLDAQEVKWESDVQRLNLYSGQGNNLFDAESVTGFIDPRLPLETARSTANNTSCNFLPGQIGACIIQDYFHPRAAERLRIGRHQVDQHRALCPRPLHRRRSLDLQRRRPRREPAPRERHRPRGDGRHHDLAAGLAELRPRGQRPAAHHRLRRALLPPAPAERRQRVPDGSVQRLQRLRATALLLAGD